MYEKNYGEKKHIYITDVIHSALTQKQYYLCEVSGNNSFCSQFIQVRLWKFELFEYLISAMWFVFNLVMNVSYVYLFI